MHGCLEAEESHTVAAAWWKLQALNMTVQLAVSE